MRSELRLDQRDGNCLCKSQISADPRGPLCRYFNFTKSKTKIAHTPTVTGKSTNCASRSALPLGTANVSNNIANAVSTPRANLLFEFMVVLPRFQVRPSCTAEQQSATSIIVANQAYCNSIPSHGLQSAVT